MRPQEEGEEDLFDRIQNAGRAFVDMVAPGFRTWLDDRRLRAEAIRIYQNSRRREGSEEEAEAISGEEVGDGGRPARAIPRLGCDLGRRARVAGWRVIRPIIRWQRRSSPARVLATYFGLGAAVSLTITTGLLAGPRNGEETRPADPVADAPRRTRGYAGRIISVYGNALPQGAASEQQRLTQKGKLIESGQLKTAVALADRTAEDRSADPASWHHAGVVALASGDRRKARLHFRKALELDPQSKATVYNLAQVEFEEGEYEEASRLLAIFRQADPKHRIAAFREVVCGLLLGRASPIPQDALPEDSLSGLCARAAVAWHGGETAAAKALLEKARAAGNSSRFEADLRLLNFPL